MVTISNIYIYIYIYTNPFYKAITGFEKAFQLLTNGSAARIYNANDINDKKQWVAVVSKLIDESIQRKNNVFKARNAPAESFIQ